MFYSTRFGALRVRRNAGACNAPNSFQDNARIGLFDRLNRIAHILLRGLKHTPGAFDPQAGSRLSSTHPRGDSSEKNGVEKASQEMSEQIRSQRVNCIVFDFAWTLCSDPYFLPLGPVFLEIVSERIFGQSSEQWADPWMCGEISSHEVAAYLSGLSGLTKEAILDGLHDGCRTLRFNPAVWEFAKAQKRAGRKTVLATANMDVFTEVVVPSHSLGSIFDVIVNTSDFGTLKKEMLWQEAFRRLGNGVTFSNSLLIDDSPRMVSMFRDMGGVAHQYTNDIEFHAWLVRNGLL